MRTRSTSSARPESRRGRRSDSRSPRERGYWSWREAVLALITVPALVLGVTVATTGAPALADEPPASTPQPAASPEAAAPEVAALAAGDPVLTITKVVVNTGGGTATPSSWTYTLTGKRNNGGNVAPAVGYTFQSGVAQSVTATETSGNGAGLLRSYAIAESGGPANYALTGIACTGATANGTFGGGTLTGLQLHSGDAASCTITNTYQAPPTAAIVVRAGGQRTGAASVGALPDGAVYQAVPVGGGAAATCAIVSGQCTITVPAGAAYTVSAQTAAPGYYLSPSLDVGSSSSGSPTAYGFRTATLAANSTTTVPGTDVTSVYTDANGNRFSGMLAQSLQNPAVQQMCGLRIALVLDQSGSMAGAKQTALKAAADDVVTSLTGTPSTLAVYTFSAAAGPSVGATSTATAASAQSLHTFIDGLPAPSSYTNWDRGLGQVGAGFDLVILLTDGNPTTSAGGGVDGSNARIAYVEQGMFSANRIKGALGERLVAVGIGVDGGAENLRAVSGPTAGSDYFTASDTGFGATLKQLATGSCSNTMTIQKRIETATGTIVDNSPAADGWDFSGTVSSGTIGAFAPTATQNGSTGFTSAAVDLPAGSSPTVSLTEAAQPGYTLDRAASSCRVDGRSVAIGGTGSTISFTGAAGAAMSCVFVNRTVQTYGTFSVTKRIGGDAGLVPGSTPFTVDYSYPAGSGYPSGSGHLTVTPGGGAVRSDPIPQGAVVHLSEAARPSIPGAIWGDPVFSANDIAIGDGTDVAVTLTNPITELRATLQLKKVVTDGLLPATDWVLTGTGDDSPTVTNPEGGDTAAVTVRTGASYTLAEAPKDGAAGTAEFVAGDWGCTDASGGTVTVDRTGPGAATLHGLSAGQAVVCTVTNTHRDQGVRLQKTLAGPAPQNADGSWTIHYTLTVVNRSTLAATVYDLGDTLHFGGGIAVQQATWSGPTSGDFTGATAVLAQGAALAAGATATYTVSVTATVGSDAWRDRTTDCPDGSGDGGFLNTATVTSAGVTASSSACDSPGTLTVQKTAGAATQGPDGHVTILYDIVVTNATPKPQFYDLADTPSPAPGVTVVSASATRNGDPIAYDGGSLAAGAAIGGGSPEHPVTDHYVVTLEVDVAALDTSHATCDGPGTGLFNAATLSTGGIVRESDACADLSTGTLTLVKSVAAGFGGDRPSDAWTLTAAGSSGRTISGRYTAADPDSAITAVRVPTGTYALSEGPAIPGYALTGLVCADAEGGPVAVRDQAIELGAGMDVTCTFTNTPRPAHLTLIKEVADPDGSGTTKTPHDWTLTATTAFDGFAPVSGRGDPARADGVDAVPVWAGRYDLSESGPTGFAAGQWTCEGAGVDGAVVTIPLGADVTCTITNTATLPRLTLVKVVDNGDTGGRGVPSDWVVSAAGPTAFGGPGSDDPADPDPAITRIGAEVGDYTLAEDASAAPAGYELAGLSCTNTVDGTVLATSPADPTLHLAEGDDVVCTFTNRAIPAAWTLSKTSDRGAAVMPGDVIRYVLTLTHTGGVVPRFLSLADVDDLSGVTPHASFVPGSLSASSGAATLEGGRLDWTLTDPSGPAFTLAYSFRVAPDAWGVTLRNALTPPRDVTCPDGACETSSSTPDLELWKTAVVTSKADPADPTRVLPGGTVAYTLSAHNPTDVDLPAGQTETDDVSGLTGHATLGTLGAGLSLDGSDRLTWTLPAVPAGATVSVGYSVTVADDAAGSTLTNTLVPGTGHCPPAADDGPGCTTSNDVPRIDLGIVKSASIEGPVHDDPGAGSEYAYTLTVANHGDTDATDAVVTDVLPEQLDLDVAKGSGGFDDVPAGWTPAYDPATSTVTVRIPSLAAGDTAAIRIHVLVRPVVHGSVDAPFGAVPPGAEGPAPVTPPSTIDNRACVAVAEDIDPSNDCSTASVPQRAVAANVWVQCQADVPYLHYAIRTTPNLSGEPVTLQWTPSRPGVNGVPATDLPADPAGVTRTLHDGDDGSILWPGAAVSADGVGVGFPGWRPIAESDYDADGALRFPPERVFEGLVYDPSTVASDAWRYPSVVTIRVNPTETYTVVYPPAVTACAVARVAQLGIVKTASTPLTHPGSSFGYTLQVDDLGLGAADPVTLTDPIPADLRVESITTDTTAFPRWQGCAVAGADGDGFGGTLTCTLFGPLSASAPSAPDVNVTVTVRSGTTASSISNTASVCSRHQGDAAAVTACADATAVVYLSVAALLAATGFDLSAAVGLALALLASGALLWTVLLRRRRRYADIAV